MSELKILKDIINQKHLDSKTLINNINKIFEQIVNFIEKYSDVKVKDIKSHIATLTSEIKLSNSEHIDKLSIETITLDEIMNIFISFDNIYKISFELTEIFSNDIVLDQVMSGKSDSFAADLNNMIKNNNKLLDQWIFNYNNAAKVIVKIIDVDDKFKQTLIQSPKNELFVQISILIADQFKGSEQHVLNRKIEEWKDSTLNIYIPEQQKFKYDILENIPLDYQYTSRFGLVPIGPFKQISDVFTSYSQEYNPKNSVCDNFGKFKKSFILFYDHQDSVIQYNILSLIDPVYIDKYDLHTERDASLTDKVLERFMNIKKINIDDKRHDKQQIQKPHIMYNIHKDDDKVYVFEYQGGDLLLELSQNPRQTFIDIKSAMFILNNGRVNRIQKYNELLENQIIKNNQLEKIKGLRIDFNQEVHISIDIITDKIQKGVVDELNSILKSKNSMPTNKYEFINLLSSKEDPFVIDYIILNSLEYVKNDNDNMSESNVSYIATMKDIIHNFKRELLSNLKSVSVPKSYFDKGGPEFKEFIIETYSKSIERTVSILQKSQAMWDDVTKSLKNYILTNK